MDIAPIAVPDALSALSRLYAEAGHELWLVGGCVRDHVLGRPCKDVDLATSATPDEQIALCAAAGLRWIGTGLRHGTITVVAGDVPYEITTFRTDVETDGRHAVVAYTRDLETDLARRDLTMNAIAMSFDGRIVDPFDGVRDAREHRVRFVGDAGTRISEDYLRILRWFRFLGRFENPDFIPAEIDAIRSHAFGLERISVERVWSETSRILSGFNPSGIVRLMHDAGVLRAIGLTAGDFQTLHDMRQHTEDPALLMAAWRKEEAPSILRRWRASTADQETAAFAASRLASGYEMADAKYDLVCGVDPAWVDAVLMARGRAWIALPLREWTIPAFPVMGRDLIAAGLPAGPAMGETLARMRRTWIDSDYAATKEDLLGTAPQAAV